MYYNKQAWHTSYERLNTGSWKLGKITKISNASAWTPSRKTNPAIAVKNHAKADAKAHPSLAQPHRSPAPHKHPARHCSHTHQPSYTHHAQFATWKNQIPKKETREEKKKEKKVRNYLHQFKHPFCGTSSEKFGKKASN